MLNNLNLGVIRKLEIYGMKNMSQFIPVVRSHEMNLNDTSINALKDILDNEIGGGVNAYNKVVGVNEEYIRNSGIINVSDNGSVPYLPYDTANKNVRSSIDASLMPRAVFLLITETTFSTPTGVFKRVYYIRGYTDRFDPNMSNDFNLLFGDDTMLYIDSISVVAENYNEYGIIKGLTLENSISLVNGAFEDSVTHDSKKLLTTQTVMLDIITSGENTFNNTTDISKHTKLIDTSGANISPTTFMKETLNGYADSLNQDDMSYGNEDDVLIQSVNNLTNTTNSLPFNSVPILEAIQQLMSMNNNGYNITPNFIQLSQLKLLYPNIGHNGNTFVNVQDVPNGMSADTLATVSLATGMEARIAYEVSLQVNEFLSKSKLYSIHLYMSPYIDEYGNVDIIKTNASVLHSKSIMDNTTSDMEIRIAEESKKLAVSKFYKPHVVNGYYLTIEVRADIRGICHIWVGFNHVSEILTIGTPTQDATTGNVNYTLQPYSIAIPLYNISSILPVLHNNKTSIIFTNMHTNQVEHTFDNIDQAIHWCMSNSINDTPVNTTNFIHFLEQSTPILSNRWIVSQRDFTHDMKHVIETVTPVYNPNNTTTMANPIIV